MNKAVQASLLIRIGSILIVLENLWYLSIEVFLMSQDNMSDSEYLGYFKMIWYGVLILDLLGFGGIGGGLMLKSQILENSERYLQAGLALLFWVLFSILWRFLLVGNIFSKSSNLDEFVQNIQTALVFIMISSIIMAGGFFFLQSTKQVLAERLFKFGLLNLLGSILLWQFFQSFDIQNASSSLDPQNVLVALTLKTIIIPLFAVIAFIQLAKSEEIDPSELPSSTSVYTY